jgi:hypothetical protein
MAAKQSISAGQLTDDVQSYFNANFTRSDVKDVQVSANSSSSSGGGTTYSLTATGTLQTEFMSLIGVPTIPLSVNSATYTSTDGLGCVLSLDQSATGAISLQGGASVNLTGCSLYDNSTNSTALSVGGSASLSALSVGVLGGVSGATSITTTNGIKTGIGAVSDPYVNDSFLPPSGCTQNNFSAKNTATIDPGVYCGGMTFNANANVTLNAGIYYIDGGSFTANGGAVIKSNGGVTLVFTKKNGSSWPTVTINGGATINLTPPTTGQTAGIVDLRGSQHAARHLIQAQRRLRPIFRRRDLYSRRCNHLLGRRRNKHELHTNNRRHCFVYGQLQPGDQLQQLSHQAFQFAGIADQLLTPHRANAALGARLTRFC